MRKTDNDRQRHVLPTQERLHQLFDYNPWTGELINRTHRHGPQRLFAGTLDKNGRVIVRVDGIRYQRNRLIWMYVYGEDVGDLEVDHKNNITHDDRLNNLSKVTHADNQLNRKDTKANGMLWKDNPLRLERNSMRGRARYHNLTPEQKKERNRRGTERRRAKKAQDP